MPIFDYEPALIDDLASRFGLRDPNTQGLRRTVFELSEQDGPEQVVLDMATGVGKTYLLAALLEYAAAQGVKNLLVVLPGKTVRTKTIANFTPGADGFITGAEIPKAVITPDNFGDSASVLFDDGTVKLFLMNVHHLVQQTPEDLVKPGSAKARTTRTARPMETLGESLLEYLTNADDLLMVLDESHSYSVSAKTWENALRRLEPAARVGLTATPVAGDNVIYRYGLREAIEDEYVKQPVVAMRREGYRDNEETGQLKDAIALLATKAQHYRNYELLHPGASQINPIMLVSCRDTNHADEVAAILRRQDFLGDDGAVLTIHSNAMTDSLESQLARVQQPDSPVRAIVQVDMLSEGWNVHNVAVLVPLRALASGTLTEQMIGRGLRLPYGKYTGNEWVDTLDILSHESIKAALKAHGLGGRRAVAAGPSRPPIGGDPTGPSFTPDMLGEDAFDDIEDSPDDLWTLTDAPHPTLFDEAPVTGLLAGLGGAARDIGAGLPTPTAPIPPVVIQRKNDTDFIFPASTIETRAVRLNLADVETKWFNETALLVGDATASTIDREVIVITDDGGRVELTPATEASVFDEPQTAETAAANIASRLAKVRALLNGAAGGDNRRRLGATASRFVTAVGGEWTPKRIVRAGDVLVAGLQRLADQVAREVIAEPRVYGVPLPRRPYIELPGGTRIVSHTSATPGSFTVQQYYDGWNRSMFEAFNFDAYATELEIARLLDKSGQIEWWTRLVTSDGARIEYDAGRSYYPDFVAKDVDGVHWIIEGKDARGREDDRVQAKRKAAERVLREMEGLDEWAAVKWGYLIAYQDDVQKAGSWIDLLSWSAPERMA